MKSETIRFTVVNEISDVDVDETAINITYFPGEDCPVSVDNLIIDKQQLAELGGLFLALAGDNVDYDSISELLDGYGLPLPLALKYHLEEGANNDLG